jgi:hypothetical protein
MSKVSVDEAIRKGWWTVTLPINAIIFGLMIASLTVLTPSPIFGIALSYQAFP